MVSVHEHVTDKWEESMITHNHEYGCLCNFCISTPCVCLCVCLCVSTETCSILVCLCNASGTHMQAQLLAALTRLVCSAKLCLKHMAALCLGAGNNLIPNTFAHASVCVFVLKRDREGYCVLSLYFVAVMSIYVYTDLCRGTQTDVFSARRWCGSLSIKTTGRSLYCAAHCSAGKPCLLVFTQV